LQHEIMGYLPGFATPRIVCDVPYVGKRWVHQWDEYDREKGISYWTKNYRTALDASEPGALSRKYEYCDPIYTLPPSGQAWWRAQPSWYKRSPWKAPFIFRQTTHAGETRVGRCAIRFAGSRH